MTDAEGLSASSSVHVDVNFVLEIGRGWNHVSLPVDPVAATMREVFADAPVLGRILQFAGFSFELAFEAKSETGYWLYSTGETAIEEPGTLADNVIEVNRLWNAIGSATEVASPSRFDSVVAVIRWDVQNQRFRFVHPADTIKPGQGYWAYAREAAVLDLSGGGRAQFDGLDLIAWGESQGNTDELLSSFR
ncbi:MAG: hypothetical protein ACI8W8_000393 [Rhodothermales bacterium]